MAISDFALNYRQKMFPNYESKLAVTDPDFIEFFDNFAFDEVINQNNIDDKTRFIAILATLLGCQGLDAFRLMLPAASNMDVSLIEMKEIVYQAVAYLGMGRVYPFLHVLNDFIIAQGVNLPLPCQATTTPATRLEKGIQAQVAIFGENMRDFYKSGADDVRHISRWLAANCFGDYYTRTGLNHQLREMITFCFLAAQGGCESQLTSHVLANLNVGNDKDFLIAIITQCLPYIGYPRSLNALACITNATKND